MGKYVHHFLPLHPPLSSALAKQVGCLIKIPAKDKDGVVFSISLLGRPHSIDVIALTFTQGALPADASSCIAHVGNHMISCLRVCYDPAIDVVRIGDDGFLNAAMESDDEVPVYPLGVTVEYNNSYRSNVDNIANVFRNTARKKYRQIISLLAEAQTPQIPTHYKILSLIRALELLLPNEAERSKFLSNYQDEFEKTKVSNKQFKNALPELRTRCAHGESRGGADPFVSPAYEETKGLSLLLCLLRGIVANLSREKYGLDVRIGMPPTGNEVICTNTLNQ